MTSPMRTAVGHCGMLQEATADAPYFLARVEKAEPTSCRGMSRTLPRSGMGLGPAGRCPFPLYRRMSHTVSRRRAEVARMAERRSISTAMRSRKDDKSGCGADIPS